MRSSIILLALVLAGCGNAKFGCDAYEVVGTGASLGDVIAKHGAPSVVHVVDSQNVILDYPIRGLSGCLGARIKERNSSISYACKRGKDQGSWGVAGGGYVADGSAESALGSGGPVVHARSTLGALLLLAILGPLVVGFTIALRRVRGVKRATLAALLLLLASSGRHKCGCENTTLCAAGSPAGEITVNHGSADEVFTLPGDGGAIVCWWIHESADNVVLGGDKVSSIAYFVQNGKVVNGGWANDGDGSYIGIRPYDLDRGHGGFDLGALGFLLVLGGLSFTLGGAVGRFARPPQPGKEPPAPPPLAIEVAPKLQAEP